MFFSDSYTITAQIFIQLLGFIYFVAHGAFIFQMKGLFSSTGVLPIASYLQLIKRRLGSKRFYYVPTLFWINSKDLTLLAAPIAGVVLSILLMLKICPPVILLLLLFLQLSIVSAGQVFLGFGWELFLLEITCNAFFLSLTPVPNPFIWMSLNVLLFRFHLQGGAVKLQSRDPNWRNLTAIAYHYQSQPIPNATAWYVHKLPLWFHKLSTAIMFIIELGIPFLIFGNEQMRLFAFFCFVGLQLMIWGTGNFSYLNYMTVALSFILVSDTYLRPIVGDVKPLSCTSELFQIPVAITGIILIILQLMNLWYYLIKPKRFIAKVLDWIQPFHIINRYGIFAIMTTERYEVVIEGSEDGETWKEYTFYYKPSELNRRPRRISPFQPRIDWQAWFLPFTGYEEEVWFQNFLYHLLVGNKDVLSLIRHNPFPETPPKYVRALLYLYEFTDFKTKKETGNWWQRRFICSYSPTLEKGD